MNEINKLWNLRKSISLTFLKTKIQKMTVSLPNQLYLKEDWFERALIAFPKHASTQFTFQALVAFAKSAYELCRVNQGSEKGVR